MTTICLAMIVRDEAERIECALTGFRDLIESWCIVDTGSADGTKEIIRDTLDDIPGEMHERPWVSFAHNRTELLELASRTADYVLMLDADHELVIHEPLPALTADSYLIRIEDSWGGRLPLVTRAAHPFEYRGAAHAYLASDVPTRTEKLDAFSVRGGGGASREKLERDLVALTAAFADDASDPRTVFYLAQTYRDLDRIPEAITYYRLRCELNGFDEERFFARYQLGVLLTEHVSFAEGAEELLRAWRERPQRIEPLRALSRAAANVADKYPVPDDSLFVRVHEYRTEEVAA